MPRHWTGRELAYLAAHASEGARAVASALGRSEKSVTVCASRYRISLRRRWLCPRCSKNTYAPLSPITGWCRACTIEESADRAALANRAIRAEVEAEQARIMENRRFRQAIYSDTNRKKRELRRLQESEKK